MPVAPSAPLVLALCLLSAGCGSGYVETGTASHYKAGFLFFPGKTAIGEKIYPWSKGAAHKTLPLPCLVRITNLENGRRVKVRVNDRGPFVRSQNSGHANLLSLFADHHSSNPHIFRAV